MSQHDDHSLFITFFINFEERNIESKDIKSIKIKSPTGQYWYYDSQEDISYMMHHDDYDMKVEYLYITNTLNLMPLGEYSLEIILVNGRKATAKLNVPAPNSENTDGYTHVYTREHSLALNPPNKFVSMPKRAIVKESVKIADDSQLTVKFLVNDNRIYNGWISFYDSNNYYIGTTDYFRNFNSGELSNIINNGVNFYTEGVENIVTMKAEDLNFINDMLTIKDISIIRVLLTDGYQYKDTLFAYDIETVSSMFKVLKE